MDLDHLDPRERLETLSAYLDGELPAEQARDVTAWLERHPEALREVEHQRRLWDLLGRYPDEPVQEGFARRVLETVGVGDRSQGQAARPHQGIRRRTWAWAAAAAVLAAVGAAVFALAPRTPEAPAGGEALAAIDVDFVQHADLAELATLSDAQFETLLVDDPDALADANLGTQGG